MERLINYINKKGQDKLLHDLSIGSNDDAVSNSAIAKIQSEYGLNNSIYNSHLNTTVESKPKFDPALRLLNHYNQLNSDVLELVYTQLYDSIAKKLIDYTNTKPNAKTDTGINVEPLLQILRESIAFYHDLPQLQPLFKQILEIIASSKSNSLPTEVVQYITKQGLISEMPGVVKTVLWESDAKLFLDHIRNVLHVANSGAGYTKTGSSVATAFGNRTDEIEYLAAVELCNVIKSSEKLYRVLTNICMDSTRALGSIEIALKYGDELRARRPYGALLFRYVVLALGKAYSSCSSTSSGFGNPGAKASIVQFAALHKLADTVHSIVRRSQTEESEYCIIHPEELVSLYGAFRNIVHGQKNSLENSLRKRQALIDTLKKAQLNAKNGESAAVGNRKQDANSSKPKSNSNLGLSMKAHQRSQSESKSKCNTNHMMTKLKKGKAPSSQSTAAEEYDEFDDDVEEEEEEFECSAQAPSGLRLKRKMGSPGGTVAGSGSAKRVKTGKLKKLSDVSDSAHVPLGVLPPVADWPQIKMFNEQGDLVDTSVLVVDESNFREAFDDIGCDVLTVLKKADKFHIFASPVTEAIAPGYFDVIKAPMDISTMQMKLARNMYKSLLAFEQDIYLMLHNAVLYNPAGTAVHEEALQVYRLWLKARSKLYIRYYTECCLNPTELKPASTSALNKAASTGTSTFKTAGTKILTAAEWPILLPREVVTIPNPNANVTSEPGASTARSKSCCISREQLKIVLQGAVKVLIELDQYNLFMVPVTEAIAPGYFDVIKAPMDISTMQMKLARNMYKSLLAFEQDIYRMLHNAVLYNPAGDFVSNQAFAMYDQWISSGRVALYKKISEITGATLLNPLSTPVKSDAVVDVPMKSNSDSVNIAISAPATANKAISPTPTTSVESKLTVKSESVSVGASADRRQDSDDEWMDVEVSKSTPGAGHLTKRDANSSKKHCAEKVPGKGRRVLDDDEPAMDDASSIPNSNRMEIAATPITGGSTVKKLMDVDEKVPVVNVSAQSLLQPTPVIVKPMVCAEKSVDPSIDRKEKIPSPVGAAASKNVSSLTGEANVSTVSRPNSSSVKAKTVDSTSQISPRESDSVGELGDPAAKQLKDQLSILSREKAMYQAFTNAAAKMGPVSVPTGNSMLSRVNTNDSSGVLGLFIPQIPTDHTLKCGLLLCSTAGSSVPIKSLSDAGTDASAVSTIGKHQGTSFKCILIQTLCVSVYNYYFQSALASYLPLRSSGGGLASGAVGGLDSKISSASHCGLLPCEISEISFLTQLIQIATLGNLFDDIFDASAQTNAGPGLPHHSNPIVSDLKSVPGVDMIFLRNFLPFATQSLLEQVDVYLSDSDTKLDSVSAVATTRRLTMRCFDISKIMNDFNAKVQSQFKAPSQAKIEINEHMLYLYREILHKLCTYIINKHENH